MPLHGAEGVRACGWRVCVCVCVCVCARARVCMLGSQSLQSYAALGFASSVGL